MRKQNSIPILTYHSIDFSKSKNSVSPIQFRKHMRYLKNNEYRTCTLLDVIQFIKTGAMPSKNPIVITFDDGYKNNFIEGYPILREYDFTATIFLCTDYINGGNEWSHQHASIPSLAMLSWNEIRIMAKHGLEYGAHTQSHPILSKIDYERARREITGSKKRIEKHLCNPVEYFSYPFGNYNVAVKEIVQQLFKAAIGNRPGKVQEDSDLYALERINAAGRVFNSLPLRIVFFNSFNLFLKIKTIIDKLLRPRTLT